MYGDIPTGNPLRIKQEEEWELIMIKKNSAFTLTELLIFIACIAILLPFAIKKLQKKSDEAKSRAFKTFRVELIPGFKHAVSHLQPGSEARWTIVSRMYFHTNFQLKQCAETLDSILTSDFRYYKGEEGVKEIDLGILVNDNTRFDSIFRDVIRVSVFSLEGHHLGDSVQHAKDTLLAEDIEKAKFYGVHYKITYDEYLQDDCIYTVVPFIRSSGRNPGLIGFIRIVTRTPAFFDKAKIDTQQ
jgi:hypothetical protein